MGLVFSEGYPRPTSCAVSVIHQKPYPETECARLAKTTALPVAQITVEYIYNAVLDFKPGAFAHVAHPIDERDPKIALETCEKEPS